MRNYVTRLVITQCTILFYLFILNVVTAFCLVWYMRMTPKLNPLHFIYSNFHVPHLENKILLPSCYLYKLFSFFEYPKNIFIEFVY